jgi:hypothetical protein
MLVVQIEKPENETLSEWFSELRSWFDRNGCQPSGFVRSGRRIDRAIYQLSFDDPAVARLFSAKFARYASVLRRATLSERSDFVTAGGLLGAG